MNQTLKNIMAIDPGASGGIAFYAPLQKVSVAIAMPDDVEQCRVVSNFSLLHGEKVCYMELVGGYIPDKDGNGQPGSAMFNFGDGYGYLRGLLAAFKIKLVLVRPQKWQIGIPGAAQKDAAKKRALKEHAARMFPQLGNVTLKTADALCILNYAMEIESQQFAMVKEKDFVSMPPRCLFNSVVAITDLPLREQYKLAEAWAGTTGHKLPKRKSIEWSNMFTYWLNHIAPQ